MGNIGRVRERALGVRERSGTRTYAGTSQSHLRWEFTPGEICRDSENSWYAWRTVVKKARQRGSWDLSRIDVGDDLVLTKFLYSDVSPHIDITSGVRPTYQYSGHVVAFVGGDDYKSPTYWNVDPWTPANHLPALGATAISRCRPLQPEADLAVAFAELYREGLPHIPRLLRRKDSEDVPFKDWAADEYLNYQFGISPIVGEIQGVHSAISNAERILSQYKRDSGRLVRRGYQFPTSVESSETIVRDRNWYPHGPYSVNWQGPCSVVLKKTVTTETWFSGAFTYYASDGNTGKASQLLDQANLLFGVKLDHEVVWNLLPWSWLIDWFSNIGDVAGNFSALTSDGLLMPWGYIMQTVTTEREYSLRGAVLKDGRPVDASQTFTSVQKLRRKASPWGFGVEWDDLSPRQIAILAALGITLGGSLAGK